MFEGFQDTFKVPLQIAGHEAGGFPPVHGRGGIRRRPVPGEQRAQQRDRLGGAGAGEPGGRQSLQTMPPSGAENAVCGPAAPQRAQSVKLGAQPPVARARSR